MADREEISSFVQSQSELGTKTVLRAIGVYRSKCGYCKNEESSSVLYWASVVQNISCEDYGELLNRGWRRSGRFLYKPIMHKVEMYVYVVCVEGDCNL